MVSLKVSIIKVNLVLFPLHVEENKASLWPGRRTTDLDNIYQLYSPIYTYFNLDYTPKKLLIIYRILDLCFYTSLIDNMCKMLLLCPSCMELVYKENCYWDNLNNVLIIRFVFLNWILTCCINQLCSICSIIYSCYHTESLS